MIRRLAALGLWKPTISLGTRPQMRKELQSTLRIGVFVLAALPWLTACGDNTLAPDIDATVEARVAKALAPSEPIAPEANATISAAESEAVIARQAKAYAAAAQVILDEFQVNVDELLRDYVVATQASLDVSQADLVKWEADYTDDVSQAFYAAEDKKALELAITAIENSIINYLEAVSERDHSSLQAAYVQGTDVLNTAQDSAAAELKKANAVALGNIGVSTGSGAARMREAHVQAMSALETAARDGVAMLDEAHVVSTETLVRILEGGSNSFSGAQKAVAEAIAQAQFAESSLPPEALSLAGSQGGINFVGAITRTNIPSQVQVVFSLRDQNGHAIVLPAEEIQKATQIFERGPGTEDWEEIDYTETSFFVHTAENFDLEVLFVLDFTNSMAQASLPDGRSGITAMLEAFSAALGVLPGAHRIGIVEFHDRNVEPGILSGLTTNREAIRDRTARFSQSDYDSGSSRVWDSVVAGIDLFSTRERNPRAVRALVFLSDGRDTSSVNVRADAQRHAQVRGVQLYAVGVGEVFQEEELRQMVASTGGGYYPAGDVSLLQEQLQLLVSDLRGQYQVSYITLRRVGEYSVGVTVELEGTEGSMQTAPLDAATFFGPDNQGVIQFDPPSIDRSMGQVTAFLRALHVPRNIDRIRFRPDTSKPLSVELVAARDGGLLDGWTLSGPDADGFYEASSPSPLEFGNLGLLFKLTISDVTEQLLYSQFEFDNTIYIERKSLGRPAPLTIDPRQIAFASIRDGNPEIYVMNADGSGVTRLTDHPDNDWVSDWSPDGLRIAFSSERDGNQDTYVMNADGTGVTRLTNDTGEDASPDWSPDGLRIAFSSERDGNRDIYVMNADGTGVTRLTDDTGEDASPDWSPDGLRIAFSSERDGNRDIYVMNADGTGVTQLTDDTWEGASPDWSPDGLRIAFSSERGGNQDIYVMNADGTGVTRLTDDTGEDASPDWSPDGLRIAFSSERDGYQDIYVMNTDGTDVRRLTDNPEWDGYPIWSPVID